MARFRETTTDLLLLRISIPAATVQVEARAMEDLRVGKTASRRVLGPMNDFAFLWMPTEETRFPSGTSRGSWRRSLVVLSA